MTIAIAACYSCPVLFAFLFSFFAVTVVIVSIEIVRWNFRPAAKRLRHMRKLARKTP